MPGQYPIPPPPGSPPASYKSPPSPPSTPNAVGADVGIQDGLDYREWKVLEEEEDAPTRRWNRRSGTASSSQVVSSPQAVSPDETASPLQAVSPDGTDAVATTTQWLNPNLSDLTLRQHGQDLVNLPMARLPLAMGQRNIEAMNEQVAKQRLKKDGLLWV